MKSFLIVLFSILNLFYFGQIELLTNLPPKIAPNSSLTIEVKIKKGNISNFSKYQIDVPAGISVSEGNSQTGNFTFEANRAKIVWVSIPAEPEFIISLNLNVGALKGSSVFNQKFFYLEDGAKKDFEPDSVNVVFDAAGATTAVAFQEKGSSASGTTSSAVNTPTVTATQTVVSSASASVTPDPVNTSSATSSAPNNTMAVTANSSTGDKNSSSSNSDNNSFSSKIDAHNQKHGDEKTEPVAKTNKKDRQSGTVSENKTEKTGKTISAISTETSSASGLVFRVQLGAYGSDPGKGRFNKAGKVSIVNEGGFYKVLCGSFTSKEDALKKLEEVKGQGLDGFVVRYQDGVRVK